MKEKQILQAARHIQLLRWAERVRKEGGSIQLLCSSTSASTKVVTVPDPVSRAVLDIIIKSAAEAVQAYGVERD